MGVIYEKMMEFMGECLIECGDGVYGENAFIEDMKWVLAVYVDLKGLQQDYEWRIEDLIDMWNREVREKVKVNDAFEVK